MSVRNPIKGTASTRPPTSKEPSKMTSTEQPVKDKVIPDIITDPSTKKTYERGKFLGKGGFAKCYELKDLATGEIVAGKIVPKSMLTKNHQKEKMAQEIRLHKMVKHKYIVKLYSYFEDPNFVYVILELCRKKSLMELHKRRQAITEPETRYFMKQMLLGCQYLHETKNIIHRDLKLGNVFLNDDLEIKIGDFGLATQVGFDGEKKRTLCGTPNYIAPEVLGKKGHSYEVDIWSLGCILYTLLVGKPPFETQTLKDTYSRIKRNEYFIPSKIGPLARKLIERLLQNDPTKRPSVKEVLEDDFMNMGYLPTRLPLSCLSMAPRFDIKLNASLIARRAPLSVQNQVPSGSDRPSSAKSESGGSDCHLGELHAALKKLVESKPCARSVIQEEDAEDPKSQPIVWVAKWVDYSDKYGFGYSLNDDSIGVVFNDLTKLLLLSDGHNIHYIDYEGSEHYYTMTEYPGTVEKKVKLLNYFKNYMKEHLLKAGANMEIRDENVLSRIPALKTWFRTSRAVVMHLSNGTIQINFFKDHTKIILCPLLGAVTYIDETRRNRTFRFDLLEKHGCSQDIASRITYAYDKVDAMMKSKVGSRKK